MQSDESMDDTKREMQHNYGVIKGGVYETRHEAVGTAAVLNRGKSVKIHQVNVLPNLLGAAEALRNMGRCQQSETDREAER